MRSVNKRGRHVSDGAVASLEEFQEVLEMMTGHRGMEESACREFDGVRWAPSAMNGLVGPLNWLIITPIDGRT